MLGEEILKHEIKNLLSFLHKGSKKTLSEFMGLVLLIS